MNKADVVLVNAGTKWRRGIVMRLLPDDRVLVLWGTGTEPRDPAVRFVKVDPEQRAGMAIGLEKTTYFTSRNIALAKTGSVRTTERCHCSPGLYLELERLIGQAPDPRGESD